METRVEVWENERSRWKHEWKFGRTRNHDGNTSGSLGEREITMETRVEVWENEKSRWKHEPDGQNGVIAR